MGDMNKKMHTLKETGIITEHAKYLGELKNGKPNGYGTLSLPNGTIYEGNWEDGKLSGKVFLRFSNGDKYFGRIKDGKPDGTGTFTWTSGKSYQGKWTEGMYFENGVFQPLRNR